VQGHPRQEGLNAIAVDRLDGRGDDSRRARGGREKVEITMAPRHVQALETIVSP
jgi:hypothetical protein